MELHAGEEAVEAIAALQASCRGTRGIDPVRCFVSGASSNKKRQRQGHELQRRHRISCPAEAELPWRRRGTGRMECAKFSAVVDWPVWSFLLHLLALLDQGQRTLPRQFSSRLGPQTFINLRLNLPSTQLQLVAIVSLQLQPPSDTITRCSGTPSARARASSAPSLPRAESP